MKPSRFPKTHTVIRDQFPNSSSIRHELYTVIHRLPLHSTHKDALPAGTTVTTYPYTAMDGSLFQTELQAIETSLAEERYGMHNLPDFVRNVVNELSILQKPFSFHDVTRVVRDTVNASRVMLLDDRDFEEFELVQGGVPGLSQRIPHEEVKAIIIKLWETADSVFSGYGKHWDQDHWVFKPTQLALAADNATPSATKTPDSQVAGVLSTITQGL